jgi:hypothetical protein
MANNNEKNKAQKITQVDLRKTHPTRRTETNIWSTNDYYWHNSSANSYGSNDGGYKLKPFQKILIREFQPDFLFNYGENAQNILGSIGGIFGKNIDDRVQKDKEGTGLASVTQKVIGKYGGAITALLSAGGRLASERLMENVISGINRFDAVPVLGTPVKLVNQMLRGRTVQRFELPFTGDTYLEASGSGWDRGGLAHVIGETVADIITKNSPIDFPAMPEWKNTNEFPLDSIIKLVLYNDDERHLIQNYKFIHALISGAYWTQLDFFQKSPNLYHVEVPGRYDHLFCTMDINIGAVGKTRKPHISLEVL